MTITVRSPSGLSIQYNDANYAVRGNVYTDLYESAEKKHWIAQVPSTVFVIEAIKACRVYRAGEHPADQLEAFKLFLDSRPSLGYCDAVRLAEIKQALRRFNGKTKRWR